MKACRECGQQVSEQAMACPKCGAPYPAKEKWDGWGFEYKSKNRLFGLPLVHISFKYRPTRAPVPAKGIIAIGQFACGVFTLAQFGLGIFSVSQFTIAGFAIAQFGIAYSILCQIGIYIDKGYGQFVKKLSEVLKMLI